MIVSPSLPTEDLFPDAAKGHPRLPPEIMRSICLLLKADNADRTLANVQSLSQQTYDIATPCLWSKITITAKSGAQLFGLFDGNTIGDLAMMRQRSTARHLLDMSPGLRLRRLLGFVVSIELKSLPASSSTANFGIYRQFAGSVGQAGWVSTPFALKNLVIRSEAFVPDKPCFQILWFAQDLAAQNVCIDFSAGNLNSSLILVWDRWASENLATFTVHNDTNTSLILHSLASRRAHHRHSFRGAESSSVPLSAVPIPGIENSTHDLDARAYTITRALLLSNEKGAGTDNFPSPRWTFFNLLGGIRSNGGAEEDSAYVKHRVGEWLREGYRFGPIQRSRNIDLKYSGSAEEVLENVKFVSKGQHEACPCCGVMWCGLAGCAEADAYP
ncbi:hypothetical protein P7C73_g1331, partial [Tremellales sp. Uapishka_1]